MNRLILSCSNLEPFITFAHKLIEVNSRMSFGSFEQSLEYFRKTGALDDKPQSSGFVPFMVAAT